MSETATMAHDEASGIGPGRLVLVVGPSGAGKDTLLRLAQAACVDDRDIVFPRRVVTRESSEAEDNIAMSQDEFRRAREHGDFAVHWEAHGHSYALPLEINDDILAGRAVVANVSRTVIGALRQAYANRRRGRDHGAAGRAGAAACCPGPAQRRQYRRSPRAQRRRRIGQCRCHYPQRGQRGLSQSPARARDQERRLARIAGATRRTECR
ncbi:energy-coupling factor transporter ATP-binding protein EcfA2 [Bradyrhizobium sp. i1.4.4]